MHRLRQAQEDEELAMEALRRMSDEERRYAVEWLLAFAPAVARKAPDLKLVTSSGRAG